MNTSSRKIPATWSTIMLTVRAGISAAETTIIIRAIATGNGIIAAITDTDMRAEDFTGNIITNVTDLGKR